MGSGQRHSRRVRLKRTTSRTTRGTATTTARPRPLSIPTAAPAWSSDTTHSPAAALEATGRIVAGVAEVSGGWRFTTTPSCTIRTSRWTQKPGSGAARASRSTTPSPSTDRPDSTTTSSTRISGAMIRRNAPSHRGTILQDNFLTVTARRRGTATPETRAGPDIGVLTSRDRARALTYKAWTRPPPSRPITHWNRSISGTTRSMGSRTTAGTLAAIAMGSSRLVETSSLVRRGRGTRHLPTRIRWWGPRRGSVQGHRWNEIRVGVRRRDPPPEYHSELACHGQQVAVPRGLGRVARHPAVRAVGADELLKVGEQSHGLPISLQRVCTRRTRLMRSQGCQWRAVHRRMAGVGRVGRAPAIRSRGLHGPGSTAES